MKIPFVDIPKMHAPLHAEIMDAIGKVASKGNFVLGDQVDSFERAFAEYSETDYAVGVDSGLSALKLALLAYDIGEGDEVILPANTFIASAAAVTFTNATPVLVEPEVGGYNIDPAKIEEAITDRTKAIMVVHLYGIPAKMDEIMAIANKHNLIVLEDASHAHGARYNNRRVGSLGHIAGFSLYPGKNLGAFGDAGIITTNDKQAADKLRALRNCGQLGKYNHVYHPYNNRLDTLQAAVLEIKLRVLDGWNEQRRQAVAWYNELLSDTSVITPMAPANTEAVWHLYVIRTAGRDALHNFLAERDIAVGIHYPIPIHKTPFYQKAKIIAPDLPYTEVMADEILSLPMYPGISREQVQYIADSIREFEMQTVAVRQ